ncbi:MAG: matrixin family metalloprotease [Deltaproteobacteria bacterium]|nr:matrixin family metalloprotease [Deltaproteobacteria bacterium]
MKRASWFLALGLVMHAELAQAFVRTHVDPNDNSSPCLFWGRRTVPFHLNAQGMNHGDNDAGFAALRLSLQQWTDVDCSDFVYQDQGFSDDRMVSFNRALLDQPMLVEDVTPFNNIMFRDRSCSDVVPANDACASTTNNDCMNLYDCWDYGSGVIALTTTTYNFETGEIFDADIELNEAEFPFTTADPYPDGGDVCGTLGANPLSCVGTDLRNTVTHESGHMLGLGHSADVHATMFASANTGETSKRDLADDDIAGICAIYPTGLKAQTCGDAPPTNKGCGCGSAEGATLLPLALGGWLARRRRNRG